MASLWRAEDEEPRSLLIDFHRGILVEERPADALRLAQLRALSNESQEVSWPAIWAGFRVIGNS